MRGNPVGKVNIPNIYDDLLREEGALKLRVT